MKSEPLTTHVFGLFWLALACCLMLGCSSQAIVSCESTAGITVICGFKNPEDIKRLPDQKTLLISQVGTLGAPIPGSLVFFDTLSQRISPAFPVDASALDLKPDNWGASHCPGMPGPEFSPLGIAVRQRDDGRWQVAAVNYGQRMSVEMFELLMTVDHQYRLAWRGCVIPPDEVSINSVALLGNGGFVASHMFDRRAPEIFGVSSSVWRAQLGLDTGYVFEWLPAAEGVFRVLEGSHGPFLNGIEVSRDENTVFVSVTSADQIRKIDRRSGRQLAVLKVERPDNISWDDDGFLLVASLTGSRLENLACIKRIGENCGLAFSIVRIYPSNMSAQQIFKHEGAPMGAATGAQQLGTSLYLGSFAGDRIVKIPYASAPKRGIDE